MVFQATSSRILWLLAFIPVLYALFRYYKDGSHTRASTSQPKPHTESSEVITPVSIPIPKQYPLNVIALTSLLVDIPSVTGAEQPAFEYAASWVTAQNLTLITQEIAPLSKHHEKRTNILALQPNTKVSDVHVIFSTHLDTVPKGENGDAKEIDGLLYGRGSVDAKGQAAAMLVAALRMRDRRVATLLVCGEEKDHAGMSNAHELGFGRIAMINGEPTEGKIATRQKGIVRATITAKGRAAHSGYPHLGDSAIDKLIDVLQALRQQTTTINNNNYGDNETTLNIGAIRGGNAANVVPDIAQADVLWRVSHRSTSIIHHTNELMQQFNNVSFDVMKSNDAFNFFIPKISTHLGTISVAYNTDVPYFRGETSKVVLFGGGSIHQAHTDNEYIAIDQLERLPELYQNIANELLLETNNEPT